MSFSWGTVVFCSIRLNAIKVSLNKFRIPGRSLVLVLFVLYALFVPKAPKDRYVLII